MNQEASQAVINKQAMAIAQLNLDKTILEVELEQAKAQVSKLQQAAQKGADDASE